MYFLDVIKHLSVREVELDHQRQDLLEMICWTASDGEFLRHEIKIARWVWEIWCNIKHLNSNSHFIKSNCFKSSHPLQTLSVDWKAAISLEAANSGLTVFGHVAACLARFLCQCSRHVLLTWWKNCKSCHMCKTTKHIISHL